MEGLTQPVPGKGCQESRCSIDGKVRNLTAYATSHTPAGQGDQDTTRGLKQLFNVHQEVKKVKEKTIPERLGREKLKG